MTLLDILGVRDEDLPWLQRELFRRAAVNFEASGLWLDAAECWADAGQPLRAAELYVQQGQPHLAAPLLLAAGQLAEAQAAYQAWLDSLPPTGHAARLDALLGLAVCRHRQAATLPGLAARQQAARDARSLLRQARSLIDTLEGQDPRTAAAAWEALARTGAALDRHDLVQVGYEQALRTYGDRDPAARLRTAQAYRAAVPHNRLLAADLARRIAEWQPAPAAVLRPWHDLRQAVEAGGFREGRRDVLHFAAEEAQLAAWHALAALDGEPDQPEIDAYLASLAPAGLLYIPAGRFLMGSPYYDPEAGADEKPQHELRLPSYYIGRCPLSNAEFARFIETGGYREPGYWTEAIAAGRWEDGKYRDYAGSLRDTPGYWDNTRYNDPQQPVAGISWYEAVAYCRWAGARLPTEAEWEKAASWDPAAGRKRRYPWGDKWDESLGNWGRKVGRTTPVGQYPGDSSAYGLGDVAGNVWEWCSTRWRDPQRGQDYRYPYTPADGREDLTGGDAAWRVVRGASWWGGMDSARRWARCGYRDRNVPWDRDINGGMRLAAPRYLSSADSGF